MLARFIGIDSLGYRKGHIYNLKITEAGGWVIITGPHPCPYGSWSIFYENWERAK